MKSVFKNLILASMLVFCLFIPVVAEEADENFDIDTSVKIGVDSHMPPYSYINDNGILKGFYIDLIHAIAIERGIDIEIRPMPIYDARKELAKDSLNLIIGSNHGAIYDNYLLSDSIIASTEVIFVRLDNKYIIEPEDLKLANVTIQKGSINMRYLRFLDMDHVAYVDNQQQGILQIMNGNAGAFIGDKLTGLYTIQKWKQDDFIKVIGGDSAGSSYYFISGEENSKYIKIMNAGLRAVTMDGTYDKIYKKWFGETVAADFQFDKRLLYALKIGILILSFAFAGIIYWNYQLKKRVDKRTLEISQKSLELENSNKFRKDVLDNVLAGIIALDTDGFITLLNRRMKYVLDGLGEARIGQKIQNTVISGIFLENDFEKVFGEGISFRNRELEIQVQDRRITFLYHIYPLVESKGDIKGSIISIRDISADKKLAEEMKRQDRLNSFGLMAAGFAHEIRNPLATIKTFTDIMPRRIDEDRFREKFIDIVPKEINRLNNMIHEILEFSKIKVPSRKSVEIKSIADESLGLLEDAVRVKGIEALNEVPEGLRAYGNEERIKQVFINLIHNSIDAVGEKGKIRIKGNTEDNMTVVRIFDDGRGMSEEAKEHIFDPFYSTKAKGTGLGLFVSYQIVKESNGEIHFESEYGKGTVAVLSLPRHPMKGRRYE
jgi:polar amino acid transport system substrate-binding protein